MDIYITVTPVDINGKRLTMYKLAKYIATTQQKLKS
jgi:hypothetical protein